MDLFSVDDSTLLTGFVTTPTVGPDEDADNISWNNRNGRKW